MYKELLIRPATIDDQQAIMDIYNDAILNLTATFDTEPRTMEKQIIWFQNHREIHPVLVAEFLSPAGGGKGVEKVVIGWASLSPWSDRCAYDTTVEVSVYVHKDHRGKGIGNKLLKAVTETGSKLNIHTVLSRITEGNKVSIHLHEKLGYKHIGVMKEVGYKFGKYLDVTMMQLVYP